MADHDSVLFGLDVPPFLDDSIAPASTGEPLSSPTVAGAGSISDDSHAQQQSASYYNDAAGGAVSGGGQQGQSQPQQQAWPTAASFHDTPPYEAYDQPAGAAFGQWDALRAAQAQVQAQQQQQQQHDHFTHHQHVGMADPSSHLSSAQHSANVSPSSLYAEPMELGGPRGVMGIGQASSSAMQNAGVGQASIAAAMQQQQQQQQQHATPFANVPAEMMSGLTPAQQEKLKAIAMPAHLRYHSPKSEPSPVSTSSADGIKPGSASPEALHGGMGGSARKRKSSVEVDDDDDDELDGNGHPAKKTTAHNMIEKRYRTNLNDKIAALRDSVPSLRIMSKSARGEDTTVDREELHGLTPAHKLNKATVLSKATEYIRHLEKRNNRLLDENGAMQARIAAFEKLFMASAMGPTMSPMQQQPPTPMQYPHDVAYMGGAAAMGAGAAGSGGRGPNDAAGMIPVPEDMKRILSQQMAAGRPYPVPQQPFHPNPAILRQQHIQQQLQAQTQRWQAPYLGKMMVGSLAGLMILEAVREREQSNETPSGRGLFAVPLQLLTYVAENMHLSVMGYYYSSAQVIWSLKMLVLMGSLLWVFVPSLFAQAPAKSSKKPSQRLHGPLEAVPSLASPIHVRRQAWLTAIQTVWVPRHNFFLEAAALLLKTMKLSLRNAIGTHGYQMLTGLTEEQEAARVKAWTIALDAQLAGGDVEINKSRLTLTFLASGTLPDTPQRLMLKALHVRVLLWELGHSGLHLSLFNLIAAKMARNMWSEARQLQRMMVQVRRSQQAADKMGMPSAADDELPDHLALLLEQSCDDVLNDNVVQRAHNLAWNRPSMHNVAAAVDGMNDVVDDAAVRSPMDAVAAWWSTLTLQKTLAAALAHFSDDEYEATNAAQRAQRLLEDGAPPSADAALLARQQAARRNMETTLDLAIRTAPIGSAAQARALVARAVLVDERRGANIAAALQATGPLDPERRRPRSPAFAPPPPPPLLSMAEVQGPGATCVAAAAAGAAMTPPATPLFNDGAMAGAADITTTTTTTTTFLVAPTSSRVPPPLIDSPSFAWPWNATSGAYAGPSAGASPDVQAALRSAMAVAHLQRFTRSDHDSFRIIEEVAVFGSGAVAGGLDAAGRAIILGSASAPSTAASMSLLGYTAAFRLMEALARHPVAADAYALALERLAGTLRIWVGVGAGPAMVERARLANSAATNSGEFVVGGSASVSSSDDDPSGGAQQQIGAALEPDVRRRLVERCLAVTKHVMGMEADTGYGSMSDEDEAADECELGVAC